MIKGEYITNDTMNENIIPIDMTIVFGPHKFHTLFCIYFNGSQYDYTLFSFTLSSLLT